MTENITMRDKMAPVENNYLALPNRTIFDDISAFF
jgi:hypothetical protein